MKIKIIVLMALVLGMLIAPTMAQNMSFADMGFAGPQTIQIYVNGTLVGTYNTTTNDIALPGQDFITVIKPEITDNLRNPTTLLGNIIDFGTTNAMALIFIGFLISVVWLGRR